MSAGYQSATVSFSSGPLECRQLGTGYYPDPGPQDCGNEPRERFGFGLCVSPASCSSVKGCTQVEAVHCLALPWPQ